jgi:hypothetical protein
VKFIRKANSGSSGTDDDWIINLGEVEVYDGNGKNIALGASASTSSLWPGFIAANANNNNPQDIVHTATDDKSPWVQIDLGHAQNVYAVRIINRQDCCWTRAIGCYLGLFDENWTPVYTSDQISQSGVAYVFAPPSVTPVAGATGNTIPTIVPISVQWPGTGSCSASCGGGTRVNGAICLPGQGGETCPVPLTSPCNVQACAVPSVMTLPSSADALTSTTDTATTIKPSTSFLFGFSRTVVIMIGAAIGSFLVLCIILVFVIRGRHESGSSKIRAAAGLHGEPRGI